MLEFKKGNPKNLEGRVLIYAYNLEHEHFVKYPAIFVTSSPDLDSSQFEEIPEYIKEKIKAEEKKLEGIIKKGNIQGIFMLASQTLLHDLKEIENIDGDVVYAGIAKNMPMAMDLLFSIAKAYIINYYTQLGSSLKIDESKLEHIPKDNYKDYSLEELKTKLYLMARKLSDSIKYKEKQKENQTTAELKAFAQGSPFFKDIINLIGITKTDHKNKDGLIFGYIEKIVAIHGEDYEKAAKIRDEIKILSEE